MDLLNVDGRAPLNRIRPRLAHRLARRNVCGDLRRRHRCKAHRRLRRVRDHAAVHDPRDPRQHRVLASFQQGEDVTRLLGVTRFAERLAAEDYRRIRPEDGVVGVFLRNLARLHQRIVDHIVARVLPVFALRDGGRDRDELRPDLAQERAAARRCRCKNKHSSLLPDDTPCSAAAA